MPVNTADDSHFPKNDFTLSCYVIINFPYDERCQQALNIPECAEKQYFFNYVNLLYCGIGPRNAIEQSLALLLLVCVMLLMFAILGTVADKFFCPVLKVFSLVMGMSEHLAGVTLLAFGNGSPDILTSLTNLENLDGANFSNMMASASYVSTFVGGMICCIYPFHMQPFNTLRDLAFLVLGALYLEYIMESNESIGFVEACSMIVLYIAYLTTILLDQYLLTRSVKRMQLLMAQESFSSANQQDILDQMMQEVRMDLVVSNASVDKEFTRRLSYNEAQPKNEKLFSDFVKIMNPIDAEEWAASNKLHRLLMAMAAPINLMLTIIIPSVNYELDRHGWSKLLNIIQIITTPILILALSYDGLILGVPLFVYSFGFTVPVAILVFLFTRTDLPPRFHELLGIYSIVGSIFLIFASANEVVNILDVIGLASGSSKAFLASTVLSWGNSLGDLIANLTIARQGYQKMGYAACIGGPLFNMLIGLGISDIYNTLNSPDNTIESIHGMLGQNSVIFMSICLFFALFGVVSTGFEGRRSIGVFCVVIYALSFVYALMGELGLVRTYATDVPHGLP